MDQEHERRTDAKQQFPFKEIMLVILGAVLAGAVDVFWVNPAQIAATKSMEQEAIVGELSKRFEIVDANDEYADAIEKVYQEYKELEDAVEASNTEHANEKKTLEDRMARMLDATVMSPDVVVDGLKQKSMKESVILYSGEQYYSGDLVNSLTQGNVTYNAKDDTVYFGTNGDAVQAETKVNVLETRALYDGRGHEVIHASDNVKLSVGGRTFKEGFTIYDRNTMFSVLQTLLDKNAAYEVPYDFNGYALFDLNGEYSELAFDVGREVSAGSDSDAKLQVYLDGVLQDEEYQLSSAESMKHIVIPLKKAKTLKLSMVEGTNVRYAFVNPVLVIAGA